MMACLSALARMATAEPPPSLTRPGLSLDLNGRWRVQPAASPETQPLLQPESWGTLTLPGQVEQWQPGQGPSWAHADPQTQSAMWLEREIEIPGAWSNHRVFLRCELLEQAAIVFIGGKRVGALPPLGDGIEVTSAIVPGRSNVLRLFIAAGEPAADRAGMYGRLGIAGALRLDAMAPKVAVEEVFLMPSVRRKQLGAKIRFNCARARKRVTVRAVVTETDGRLVRTFDQTMDSLPAGESFQELAFAWPDPVLWELDRPHLYRITVEALDAKGETLDRWGPDTFGFREFWLKGKEMILNGHPCRFRLIWHWGVGENNLAFYQGIAFNAVEIQPQDYVWFGNWGRNEDIDKLADLLDRNGMALIAPSRSANALENTRSIPPRMRDYYVRASRLRIWRYANHPSILAWNVAMNAAAETREWMPPLIGQNPSRDRARNPIAEAARLVERLDPSRSVFSHAGGNIAPIASGNLYLNFLPLQEREEWLSDWARGGKRPWAASEFGPPYHANFYRKGGPEPLFTEYCAMFVGDEAYRLEGTEYVAKVADITQANTSGHGTDVRETFEQTAFFPVVTEFVRRTNRAWRAWGHNGGSLPWMFSVGFGDKPAGPMNAYFYTDLTGAPERLRQRPAWANPYYDAYRETMQPLLVYIGGRPERFTEHDHALLPGQTVQKQIIAIWDEGWPTEITASWQTFVGRERIAGDTLKLALRAGEIRMIPFSFTVPTTERQADGRIRLVVRDTRGARLSTDQFRFQVIPRPKVTTRRKVLLWDPRGESQPWIASLGVKPLMWQPGEPLGDASVLVIGRNALTDAAALPFTLEDVERGLTVLMLEQQPATLRRLGFRVEETYSRRLFPRIKDHPVLAGIDATMLQDWHGSATLLPENEPMRWNGVRPRVYHQGNYGVVASAVIEVPHHGNFTPIIDGEFDMRYSPLIEWRCGKGRILFNQLDLTGRVGYDAVATAIAANLLRYAVSPEPNRFRRAIYVGGPVGRKLVTDTLLDVRCDVTWPELPALLQNAGLLIIGEGASASLIPLKDDLVRFVSEGGFILSLPKSADELNTGWLPFAVRTEQRRAHCAGMESIDLPAFRGLGPADFHWRDIGSFTVFTKRGQPKGTQVVGDGFFLWANGDSYPFHAQNKRAQQNPGEKGNCPHGGAWLLCQADPAVYAEENAGTVELEVQPSGFVFADDAQKHLVPKPWLRYTRQRMDRMYAQIIANLGAAPAAEVGERLIQFIAPPDFISLSDWEYTQPSAQGDFDTLMPPQPEWLAQHPGEPMPSMAWRRPFARDFDQRAANIEWSGRTGIAFFRATYASPRAGEVAIRCRHSGTARIGIWCNGTLLARYKGDVSRWRWAHECFAPLREGRNDFLVKIQGPAWVEFGLLPLPDARLGARGVNLFYRDPQLYGDDAYAWYPW
jgi:beta-galactosidase